MITETRTNYQIGSSGHLRASATSMAACRPDGPRASVAATTIGTSSSHIQAVPHSETHKPLRSPNATSAAGLAKRPTVSKTPRLASRIACKGPATAAWAAVNSMTCFQTVGACPAWMYPRIKPAYPAAPYSPLPRFSKKVDTKSAPSATRRITSTCAGSRAGSLKLLNLEALAALLRRTRWCMRCPPSGIAANFRRGWRRRAEAFRRQMDKTHRAGPALRAVAGDSGSRRDTTQRTDTTSRIAEFDLVREKRAS